MDRMIKACTYKIFINNLRLYGYHGVFEEEQKLGQEFLINLEMTLEAEVSSLAQDDIQETVSYADVVELLKQEFKVPFKTLEALSLHLLGTLKRYSQLKHARLNLAKTAPPIDASLDAVGVDFEMNY